MGSRAPEPTPPEDSNDDIHVLVTGFGPFADYSTNPSYLIATALPPYLSLPSLPKIHLHVHRSPIRVAYKTVRKLIPALLFSPPSKPPSNHASTALNPPQPNFDIILHIGMAPKRKHFAMEARAHRDLYKGKDVDGQTMSGDTFWQHEYDAPPMLETGFNAEDVCERWKQSVEDEDVRLSDDAGRYLCEFIYYTSLVEHWRRDLHDAERRVMFLHVPGAAEREDVERGVRVTEGLVGALVGSWLGGARRRV